MGTRSVRLDDESESVLNDITRSTGKSITDVFKRSLELYLQEVNSARTPSDFFKDRELSSGHSIGDARNASTLLKKKIQDELNG